MRPAWLVVCACLAPFAAPSLAWSAELPRPTGPSPVGTVVAHRIDAARPDSQFAAGRPLTIQLWYPARPPSGGAIATYMMEPSLGELLAARGYYGVDSTSLLAWSRLPTHARIGAPIAAGRHPLLTLSVGLGIVRANYTSLAEELASHGTIVAMVESPLAGLMVLPDGRVVEDTTAALDDPAIHRRRVDEWARDITFALDELVAGRLDPALAGVSRALDPERIGAIGHSSGGLVAVQASVLDPRVRACANLDGGLATPDREPLADFVAAGVVRPTLFLRSQPLYSDADLARRGLTREQWEARGAGGRAALDTLVARSRAPLLVLRVAGTGHMTFSDAPFLMPETISRFGGTILDARGGWLVITSTLREFFAQAWRTSGKPAFRKLAGRFPELSADRPTRR